MEKTILLIRALEKDINSLLKRAYPLTKKAQTPEVRKEIYRLTGRIEELNTEVKDLQENPAG